MSLKKCALYLTWPTQSGHVYQDCLAPLYSIDVIFPEFDSVLVPMTPRMQAVIDFFGLRLSSKLKFVYSEDQGLSPISALDESGVTLNRPSGHGRFPSKNISDEDQIHVLKKEFQRLRPIVNTPKQYLIFCSRNNTTLLINNRRRMIQENEDEIVAYLKEYANEHNLEFHLLTGQEPDGSETSLAKQYELFTNAKIAIGPHGAAFANIIHLDPAKKAKVIEFSNNTHNWANFKGLLRRAPARFCEYHNIPYWDRNVDADLPHIDIMQIKSLLE